MITMPICWKCCNQIIIDRVDDLGLVYFEVIGCKECEAIKSYKDAEKMCPLLGKKGMK